MAVRSHHPFRSLHLVMLLLAMLFGVHALAVDADRDALPDDWELANGRNPNTADYGVKVTNSAVCVLSDQGNSCPGTYYSNALGGSISNQKWVGGYCQDLGARYTTVVDATVTCQIAGARTVQCTGNYYVDFYPASGSTAGLPTCQNSSGNFQTKTFDTLGNLGHISGAGTHHPAPDTMCALTDRGVECWSVDTNHTTRVIAISLSAARSDQIDPDQDGIISSYDSFPLDTDNDGMDNDVDADDDNDGVADTVDKFPLDATRYQNPRHNADADIDSDVLVRSASLGTWTRYSVQNNAIVGNGAMNAPASSDSVYVAQLDANGDGDADILTRSASTGAWSLSIVESGAVANTTPIYLYANLDQQFVGSGDFNNDGIDDVMLRSASAGYYTVFLLANHAVNSTVFYNAWTSAQSVPQGIGDFDGDGTDDLLVRRTSDNLYFIFKTTNGATTNNYCACNIWANPDWSFQFAGDTNKDGIDDVIIRGTGPAADGKWWAFRMNNFSSVLTTNLNLFLNKTAVSVGAVGDYNGDGTMDVLTRVNNSTTYVSPIVNGAVTGNYWLYNFTADQVIGK